MNVLRSGVPLRVGQLLDPGSILGCGCRTDEELIHGDGGVAGDNFPCQVLQGQAADAVRGLVRQQLHELLDTH